MSETDLKAEENENPDDITTTLDNLRTTRAIIYALKDSDIESATQFGRDTILIITNLLSRVVTQIGQTNVQPPTLESLIVYVRNLMHTRSAHMRQTVPTALLIAWYEVSQLMSIMQNEPEVRITARKSKQLVEIAYDTAIWTYKQLTIQSANGNSIDFIDRSSIPYTYE